MENNIIIAGAGTMGTHYTRNLVNMWDELNMSRLTVVDTDATQLSKIREISPRVETEQADATSARMRSIVQVTGANGLIGATQTDTHLGVLKAALTVGGTTTQIRHLLQEKPLGMFSEQDSDFNFIRDLIRSADIHMNLDSILMFSDIYDVFDRVLIENPGLEHVGSLCVYGKDRTKDNRPAHMGVFGTEGTHAIDIARRLGHTMSCLATRYSTTLIGDLTEKNTDIPYACMAQGMTLKGVPIEIHMSLAFDQTVRHVRHDFRNARGEPVSVELSFDIKDDMVSDGQKVDRMVVRDTQTMDIISAEQVPAGKKMENALRATFGQKADFQYGMDQVTDLRRSLGSVMQMATIKRVAGTPELRTPPSLFN